MFERILLALDDSPAGEVATAFAGALAQRAGTAASVHVLHVNEGLVGGHGLTYVSAHFLPALTAAGVPPEALQTITVSNPRTLLTVTS